MWRTLTTPRNRPQPFLGVVASYFNRNQSNQQNNLFATLKYSSECHEPARQHFKFISTKKIQNQNKSPRWDSDPINSFFHKNAKRRTIWTWKNKLIKFRGNFRPPKAKVRGDRTGKSWETIVKLFRPIIIPATRQSIKGRRLPLD